MLENNKLFDFKNINNDTTYVGDIYKVKRINKKLLIEYLNAGVLINDINEKNGPCETVLIKKDAILIKVSDNYFIDIDFIKDLQDCDYINFCLKQNIPDIIFLKRGIFNPFVGQLFVRKLKRCKSFNKSNMNIKELKLLNNKK